MKTFYIYDSVTLPTGYNHRFFVEKFAKGFTYHGYNVKVVNKPEQIKNSGFVMLADHPFYYSFGTRNNRNGNKLFYIPSAIDKINKKIKILTKLNDWIQARSIENLARCIKNKEVTLIAWFRHPQNEFIEDLGIPTIYTGEYFYAKPSSEKQLSWYNFYKKNKNALPIEFAADIDPNKIGQGCKNKRYIVSYVGNKSYKPYLYNVFLNKKNCSINPTPPYITESRRIKIYKNSLISLGFHANINIKNAIVNERVFEALAYGAICITDNKYAVKATDGLAILVHDKSELIEKIDNLKNDSETVKILRAKGFEFIQKRGTYYHRAEEFINLNSELYS
ncbi:MAG: glycosyltransferase family protein [Caldisphaera sp.]